MKSRIIVCKASAGSGKTRKLIEKVFNFIHSQNVKRPEQILEKFIAITFTNASADEMKRRIIRKLKEKALDKGRSEMERRKYSILVDTILLNYSDFHISTIDSLVNAIISSAPADSETLLFPEYDIVSDPTPYMDRALDIIFKRYNEENNEIKNLVDEFIEDTLFATDRVEWDIRKILKEKFENYRRYENVKGVDIGYGESDKRYERRIKEDLIKAGRDAERLIYRIEKGSQRELQQVKEEVGDKKIEELVKVFSIKKGSRGAKIYTYFKNEMKEIAEREKKVFLDELNKIAASLMDEGNLSSLLVKLGVTLEAVFIDEFQDTSSVQWKNLYPLIDEVLARGGFFFCVGDKKQAIYGFRGGAPDLIDNMEKNFTQAETECIVLRENWRSARKIVEFNNCLFSPNKIKMWLCSTILSKEDLDNEDVKKRLKEVVDTYKEVKQEGKREAEGYVCIKKIDTSQGEDYYAKVINYLEEEGVFERYSLSDIAFLVRSNKEVKEVTGALMDKGKSAESPQTLDVRENPRIKEIISFLKFIIEPEDEISFCNFITSEIFERVSGLSRIDVLRWVEGKKRAGIKNLCHSFREDYEMLYSRWFNHFVLKIDYLPLYEFIKEIYETYNIYSLFPDDFWAFRHFEEVIHNVEEDGIMTIPSFLEFINSGKGKEVFMLSPSSTNAVKVMTIHKAKGLEFSVVVLPVVRLQRGSPPLRINELIKKEEDKNIGKVMYCNKKLLKHNEELRKEWLLKLLETARDELNVLYVGFTRAKDELYAFLPEKNNMYLEFILKEGEIVLGSKSEKPIKYEGKEESNITLKGTVVSGWESSFIKGRPYIPQRADDILKRLEGEFIHDVLARIHIIHNNAEEIIEKSLRESEGKWSNVNLSERMTFFKEILVRALTCNKLAKFFSPDIDAVYTEKEVCSRKGELKRIDRVILKGDKIFVVDFKWGGKNVKEHAEQVRKYIETMKEIYPEKRVEGFVVYLEDVDVVKVSI